MKILIPAAACVVIILSLILAIPRSINIVPEVPDETKTAAVKMSISMNELKSFPEKTVGDIALLWDDFVAMTTEELAAYYGTAVVPTYLPETFDKQMVAGNLGIFKRADGTVYYDNNELKYQSKDGEQSIVIVTAKGHLPQYDVMNVYNGELKASRISGHTVLLVHYKDTIGEHYYAEFLYNNVGFNLWGNDISKDDFIKVLASYFKN